MPSIARHFIIRSARGVDAAAMAEVYVESWRDTYPLLLPARVLLGMSKERMSAALRADIERPRARDVQLVADLKGVGVIGMATGGLIRDRGCPIAGVAAEAEVYTLYVHPSFTGYGAGGTLLSHMLRLLRARGASNAVLWMLHGNPARYFYEAAGAQIVARKAETRWGIPIELEAYGWPDLSLVRAGAARRTGRLSP